jgi:hypothetical protein
MTGRDRGTGDAWCSKLTVMGCISIFLRPILAFSNPQGYGRANSTRGVEGNEIELVDKPFTKAMNSMLVFGIEFADPIPDYRFLRHRHPLRCTLDCLAEIHHPFTKFSEIRPTMEIDCTCIASVLSAAAFPTFKKLPSGHRLLPSCNFSNTLAYKFSEIINIMSLCIIGNIARRIECITAANPML